ncbi:putative oligopeptidase A, partial [Operophtera brumata]
MYFDHIGRIKFYNDYLHVLAPVDISYIKPHIDNINSVLGTTRFLCQQLNNIDDAECHNILEPLTSRLNDLIKDYAAISHLIPLRSTRSAWIAGGGSILKQIFGTMDENDALKYDSAV